MPSPLRKCRGSLPWKPVNVEMEVSRYNIANQVHLKWQPPVENLNRYASASAGRGSSQPLQSYRIQWDTNPAFNSGSFGQALGSTDVAKPRTVKAAIPVSVSFRWARRSKNYGSTARRTSSSPPANTGSSIRRCRKPRVLSEHEMGERFQLDRRTGRLQTCGS